MRLAFISGPDGIVSRPIGLDWGAIMTTGIGRGVDTALLAEILPEIEAAVIHPPEPDAEGDADGDA